MQSHTLPTESEISLSEWFFPGGEETAAHPCLKKELLSQERWLRTLKGSSLLPWNLCNLLVVLVEKFNDI